MKIASAIQIENKIYLQGYSRADSGVWIAGGAVFKNDRSDGVTILGISIMNALNNSVEGVSHPDNTEWGAIQRPMLEAANVKSWEDLAENAKAVGIEYDGDRVVLIPSAEYKNNGGVDLVEHKIEVAPNPDELGSALLLAFKKCR